MSEILSRGKWTRNGKWIEGFYARIHDGKGNVSHRIYSGYAESDCGDFYPENFEVDPSTVGRFTGLPCDKNGKKIFEGDILHYWSEDCEEYLGTCVVRYGKFNCGCCDGVYGWYLDGGDIRLFHSEYPPYYEVCGNIHDNPELLEAVGR